jgi:hypothetical protein
MTVVFHGHNTVRHLEEDRIKVTLKHETWEMEFKTFKSASAQTLVDIAARRFGKEAGAFSGFFDGRIIGSEQTVGGCGIEDGGQVDLRDRV